MADKTKNSSVVRLAECAVMLALSIVLSFIAILKMPMGGEVTLLSMLPVMLIGVKYGPATGLTTAFLYAVFQLVQGILSGNVFVYIESALGIAVCAAFDYIVPFTLLGLAGVFKKRGKAGVVCGIALMVILRFVCHYITGVYIWGQWAEEGMSKYLYSLLYNGQYMLPECIFTTVGAAILVNIPQIQKLLDLNFAAAKKEEPAGGSCGPDDPDIN